MRASLGTRSAHSLTPDAPPGAARVFFAIVYGTAAGILGLTNTLGLLSYLVAMALVRPLPFQRSPFLPPRRPSSPSPRPARASS